MKIRLMSPALALAAAAALTLLSAGGACAANAHKNGYLQDYHRLGHIGGVPLEQVWIHPELNLLDYRTLYIAPVQIDPLAYRRNGEQDRQAGARLGGALRNAVTKELQGAGIFQFVSDDPYFSVPRHGALVLEMRITEVNSGKPRLRQLVGFGAGATEIQLEGKLIEARTCRTLFEFADRRLHPGDALLMGRTKSQASEYLMGIDLRMMMGGIIKLFIYLREQGPPSYQRI